MGLFWIVHGPSKIVRLVQNENSGSAGQVGQGVVITKFQNFISAEQDSSASSSHILVKCKFKLSCSKRTTNRLGSFHFALLLWGLSNLRSGGGICYSSLSNAQNKVSAYDHVTIAFCYILNQYAASGFLNVKYTCAHTRSPLKKKILKCPFRFTVENIFFA